MTVEEFINYIDARWTDSGGESYWINDLGERITVDAGYAIQWWNDCMKPELLRKFGGETINNQQSFFSHIFDWNYTRLAYKLDQYHQLEDTIKFLSGYSLESLKQLLARGYTLEPPNYDATTLVEALELMEREKGESV